MKNFIKALNSNKHLNLEEMQEAINQIMTGMAIDEDIESCLLYTSPSPRDQRGSRMPSSA